MPASFFGGIVNELSVVSLHSGRQQKKKKRVHSKMKMRFNRREGGGRSQPFSPSRCTTFPLSSLQSDPRLHSRLCEPIRNTCSWHVRDRRGYQLHLYRQGDLKRNYRALRGFRDLRGTCVWLLTTHFSSFMTQRKQKAGVRENEGGEGGKSNKHQSLWWI